MEHSRVTPSIIHYMLASPVTAGNKLLLLLLLLHFASADVDRVTFAPEFAQLGGSGWLVPAAKPIERCFHLRSERYFHLLHHLLHLSACSLAIGC